MKSTGNGFRFQRGALKPIQNISEERVRSELRRLWNSRRASAAVLHANSGDFIQTAGSTMTCVVERWDAATKSRHRAVQESPVVPWNDDVLLPFSGGCVPLKRNEWFRGSQAAQLFLCFYNRQDYPDYVQWRDVTHIPNIEHTVDDPAFKSRTGT